MILSWNCIIDITNRKRFLKNRKKVSPIFFSIFSVDRWHRDRVWQSCAVAAHSCQGPCETKRISDDLECEPREIPFHIPPVFISPACTFLGFSVLYFQNSASARSVNETLSTDSTWLWHMEINPTKLNQNAFIIYISFVVINPHARNITDSNESRCTVVFEMPHLTFRFCSDCLFSNIFCLFLFACCVLWLERKLMLSFEKI